MITSIKTVVLDLKTFEWLFIRVAICLQLCSLKWIPFCIWRGAWLCNYYMYVIYHIPCGGKLWRGKTLANLANRPWFAKLKLSKLVLIINNLLTDLLIRQTFFRWMLKMSQFTNIPPAKVSLNTVANPAEFISCINIDFI